MATDTFVNQLQRVGTTAAGLLPGQSALVFSSSLFIITAETGTVSGADGGSITGYYLASLNPSFASGVVTWEAVKAAIALADSAASFNGQNLSAGDLSLSGPIYQGSATSGSGNVRGGSTWRLYGAQSGTPTVADVPLFVWSGGDITIGSDANVGTVGVHAETAFTVAIGSGSHAIEVTETSTYIASGTLVTIDGPAVTVPPIRMLPTAAPATHATEGTLYYSNADGKWHARASVADGGADVALY